MEISIEALKKRYQYEHPRDLVGKGGFADVYKAYDTEDQIWVALKFYKGDWSSKYNVNNEIRRIKKYRHENLIEHIEAYEVISGHDIHGEPIRYQVGILEFANAGPLTEFIKNQPAQQLLGVLIEDVMEGLRYLHSKNIVHRDLKPHNILLFSNGERLTAKIADFGIARLLDGSDATSSHVIGTIEYMSPEHFAPNIYGLNGKLGINADLWALGVMIYEMYTGKVPFGRRSSGNTQQEIIAGILNGALPQDEVDNIPQPYQDIVRRCLVRNASDRARSIDELRLLEIKQTNAAQAHDLREHEKEAAQRATEQEAVRQEREVEAATISDPKKRIVPSAAPDEQELSANKNVASVLPSPGVSATGGVETVTIKSDMTAPPAEPAIRADEGATVTMKADTRAKNSKTEEPTPVQLTTSLNDSDDVTQTVRHTLEATPTRSGSSAKTVDIRPPAQGKANNRVAIAVVGTALVVGGSWLWFLLDDRPVPTKPISSVPDTLSEEKVISPPEPLSQIATTKPTTNTSTTALPSEPVVKEPAAEPTNTPKFYEGLMVKERAGLYGYVDASGRWVIPARYESAVNFLRGKARVLLNGRIMVINRQGKCLKGCPETPQTEVAKAEPSVELNKERTLQPQERNGRYGFVDEDGNEVIKFKYQSAKAFSEGLAAVSVNGSWGYINQSGSVVIPYQYEGAISFRNGRARVLLDGEWFYIDKGGNRTGE